MAGPQRILVVDDDDDIRMLLRELFTRAGYEVTEAGNGREALKRMFELPPSLVVLDVTMPELDGYQTLERIRDLSEVPVVMLTARTQELERVRGLATGADDYVAKPFVRQELLDRVQALLQRDGSTSAHGDVYRDAFLELDQPRRRVLVRGGEVDVTELEFKLLAALVRQAGEVLSREALLELVWGDPYGVPADQVERTVVSLRGKLDPAHDDAVPIETVRGFGYRYRRA
jgi:DNA-binding response OmpR family regulator